MNLDDVQTIAELCAFSKEKARTHRNYYHYTNWNSFELIMQGKSFLLTRGNSLSINDQHEYLMKGSIEEWNKTYIGSFSFGTSENMAMWGLYGMPWEDAVRICIPKNAMLKWVDSIDKVYVWKDAKKTGNIENADINLVDIIYSFGKDDLKDIANSTNVNLSRDTKSINTSGRPGLHYVNSDPQITGYIKNYAWNYEKEVRMRIHLPFGVGTEKVMVDIPDEVLSEITVTTGPSFTYRDSELYKKLRSQGRIKESDFENLLNYRPLCKMCAHGDFSPKK